MLDTLLCIFFSFGEGTSSNSLPTVVIAVVTAANILILLIGCTLLVIGLILMVKRKRQTCTVQHTLDPDVRMYDEVGTSKFKAEASGYQELDITRMEKIQQYTDLK